MLHRVKNGLLLCLFLFASINVWANVQQNPATGQVLDQEGSVVPGASVILKGTTQGAATDINGKFSLPNVPNGSTLEVSSIGYASQEVVWQGQELTIVLSEASQDIEEVTVVAYGTAKRSSVTGSVSMVGEKELEKRITTSVTAALEGATPGVQVNNTYGEPGSSPSIRIRGFTSMRSNTPLYVIDGVPYDGAMADLNPNDIESLAILKDAASAALYGNRAANGVVLITTKRGKANAGKPQVTVSTTQGFYERGLPEYERLDPNAWMEASWIAMRNSAMSGATKMDAAAAAEYASTGLLKNYARRNIWDKPDTELFDANGKFVANILPGYDDLDWAKDFERKGYRQEYNVSGSAGTDKYNVYASTGYLNEKGYVYGSDYERFTGRINTNFTPNRWFKTGANVSASTALGNKHGNATGSYYANPFYNARFMAPNFPIYMHNEDGSLMYDENGDKIYDTTSSYLSNRNIGYELRKDIEQTRRNSIQGQAYATIVLPYGFDFTMRGDMTMITANSKRYSNPEIGDGAADNGRLNMGSTVYRTVTLQQLLNWEKQYGMHNVGVMLGHESYSYGAESISLMNTSMAVANNYSMGNFLTNSTTSGAIDADKLESYLSRVKYNYNEKYFFEASFRRDGSSRFAKDNRWGNFFSVGASWNLSREAFMQNVSWVDRLKLRAAYGEVGNNAAVGLYAYQALYTVDKNAGTTALIKSSLAAPDIRWETTQTVDVALEGTLFNRLNFELGYFDKRSKDMLFAVKLPYSAGTDPWGGSSNLTRYRNIGSMSNKGLEVALDADVVRTKGWTWNLGLDLTMMRNKIVKLPDDNKEIPNGQQYYSVGHSIYEYYNYKFEGVDRLTGRSLYLLDSDPEQREAAIKDDALVTINGVDYTTITTYAQRTWNGSALPNVYGSLKSMLAWNGFTLNLLFTYSLGGKMYDSAYASLMSTSSASSPSANHVDLMKSWMEPAAIAEDAPDRIDPNGIPVIDFNLSTDNNAASSRWLVDASYFVFKNVNLSYALPKRAVNAMGLEGLSLFVGGENLFTLTARKGLNPQYSFSGGGDNTYVTARVLTMGLTLKF